MARRWMNDETASIWKGGDRGLRSYPRYAPVRSKEDDLPLKSNAPDEIRTECQC
jgi:hypothetical protein